MAYDVKELNRRIREDVKGFLEESDAAYSAKIANAADQIIQNLSQSPILLLSGPSGSGKTTTAKKVEEELERRGVNTHTISMDDYFKTLDRRTAPRTENGDIDYESPLLMDMELLDQHFSALAKGEEIQVPKYSFTRQMRDSAVTPLRLGKNEVAIFEGIHALNDDTAGRHPAATRMYISARSQFFDGDILRFKSSWLRLTRRAVRDYNFRGTGVAETMAMWANVRRGEKLYISPYKHRATVVVDSALPYEVSVMKNYAAPLLEAVSAENERHQDLMNLLASFQWFEEIDPALVAPNSLLREFIGNSSYHN